MRAHHLRRRINMCIFAFYSQLCFELFEPLRFSSYAAFASIAHPHIQHSPVEQVLWSDAYGVPSGIDEIWVAFSEPISDSEYEIN